MQGKGDALLTYENEAVFTNLVVSPNEVLPCIVPDNNVRVSAATSTGPPAGSPVALSAAWSGCSRGGRASRQACMHAQLPVAPATALAAPSHFLERNP